MSNVSSKEMMETWHLETSAINFLCDQMEEHDALATRHLQRISLMPPVTQDSQPLSVVPFRYHNDLVCRQLVLGRRLPNPWPQQHQDQ